MNTKCDSETGGLLKYFKGITLLNGVGFLNILEAAPIFKETAEGATTSLLIEANADVNAREKNVRYYKLEYII